MRKPRNPILNWLSFNQHRKRFGAARVVADLDSNYQQLKNTLITGDAPEYTYGSEKNLNQHIDNLRKEFVGQSELNYHHAKLIVLIRRGVDARKHFAEFERLWYQESDFLIEALNTRWLISACDTFIDYSSDETLKALLMNAVILINTIKLQESERFLLATEAAKIVPERQQSLQNERLALFDGVSGFAVGTDDTLRNMRWRLDKLAQAHDLGQIVISIFERVQQPDADTVYSRFRGWHHRDKTAWWTT